MENIVRELNSVFSSIYTYNNILLLSNTEITFLNVNNVNDFSRDVRVKYSINISKDNNFSISQIETICINLDYINELIKDKILSSFPKSLSDEIGNTYEYKFDIDKKDLIITMEYRIVDRIEKDHNNHAITKIIIDILLESAKELKE